MVVLLLFFSKEEVLAIVPSGHWVWTLIRPKIDKYYNVISFFVMGLFILNNPYVGYASLAWYLLAFIPISVAVIYGAALIHHYLRQQSLNFFVEERDEELEDRFEYAKMYYGFFVIISFFVLFFGTFALLSKVWNLPYTPSRLWYLFSQEWVLPLEFGKFGLVEFITVVIFLFCGYVISSVGKHFVISRILDIFNAEDGARNTFSRIFHYTVVMLSFIAGCFYVGLSYFVLPLIVALLALIGFGAKDMVTDFAAGLLILLERHIEIGHFIKTPVIRGTIYSISARTTTIRTAQNYFVFIPNRELISKPIVNWGCGRFSVGFEMKIEVSYDNNPEHVMSVIKKMLYAHPLVLRVPPAVIRVDDFCDSGILYFTRAFVSIRKVREQWDVASELRVALYKAFTDEGISMPYPRRVIQYDPRPVAPDVPPSKGLSIMFDEEPFGPSQTGSK
jgi:small-conductance mechanosensitive channel